MNALKHIRTYLTFWSLVVLFRPVQALAQEDTDPFGDSAQHSTADRDGQHDFDFEIGTWKQRLKRPLLNPSKGSTTWVEFKGTIVGRKVWNGRATLDEFEVEGPAGPIEGLTLRLYNPQTHQWSLYWADSKAGTISGPPNIGEFKNGRGEFFCQDIVDGRYILVRYVWSDITRNSYNLEQSYSYDGGKTWEVNWISIMTRVTDESDSAHSSAGRLP
ncbi:MAG: hypothetical protein ABSE86_00980 [Bryobacteraceae bacterium]|jgi:hypothetical protein